MRLLCLLFLFIFNVTPSHALEISVESGSFKSNGQTYLEAYVRVIGHSAGFKELAHKDGYVQASIDITIFISQNDEIVTFQKFNLNSPELTSVKDFLDVKRFAIAPGRYKMRVEAIDRNNQENKLDLEKSIIIDNFRSEIELSDIQLFGKIEKSNTANPLTKNGVYMEPLSYGLVTEDIDQLSIYAEAYLQNTKSQGLFVKYSISEGFVDIGGGEVMKKVQRLNDDQVQPLLLKLPVDKLPSGNYRVEIEIMDKTKTTLDSKAVDFIRSNPSFDQEFWDTYNIDEDYSFVNKMSSGEIDYALRATSPTVFEPYKNLMDYMVKDAPLRAQKKFLFSIWKDRAPQNTELQYLDYLTIAKAVDLEFNSNVGYGFETDRGYIFMRYGKPNNILTIDQEPDAYPYEIWYYTLVEETTQTNVRFLFYNKSLVDKDFRLLHSTCRGETQNPAWEMELYGRGLDVREQSSVDGVEAGDGWNRQARAYFNQY